jgi:hypothetical protein
MRSWVTRADMIECVFSGVLKCTEGTFPLEIGIRGTESAPGADGSVRQWEIVPAMNGFFLQKQIALTPYGWRMLDLELGGGDVGREFIEAVRRGPTYVPWAYQTMVAPNPNLELWRGVSLLAEHDWWGDLQRLVLPIIKEAARVPLLAAALTPEYQAHRWDKFFRRPGGEPASEEQEKRFLAAWESSRILPPGASKGGLLPNNDVIDAYLLVTLTDRAVEVRVPCELPEAGAGGQRAFRARVVVECADPAVLEELRRLRAEADPDRGTVPQPTSFGKKREKWRVVAIESDLLPIPVNSMPKPDQPGGMAGGPPQ